MPIKPENKKLYPRYWKELSLYVGAKIYFEKYGIRKLSGVSNTGIWHTDIENNQQLYNSFQDMKFQLILKPLHKMSMDDRESLGWQDDIEFDYLSEKDGQVLKNYYYGWQFLELLKKNYDLFYLIKNDLAFDEFTFEELIKSKKLEIIT